MEVEAFISDKNLELEQWIYLLGEYKPLVKEYFGDVRDLLTEEEYENWMLFCSYDQIKDNLAKENRALAKEIINDFYLLKLPILKPILPSVIKEIEVSLNHSNNNKKHFEDLKTHIEKFYFKSMSDNSAEKETQQTTAKEPDWHPFHNDDVRDFYFYLESKYNMNEGKNIFSAFWKFFEREGLIDLNEKLRIRSSYFNWINIRYNFNGNKKIVDLQGNLKSYDLSDFEKHYVEFESSKGDGFRFHDFRDENIQRTKKKRPKR